MEEKNNTTLPAEKEPKEKIPLKERLRRLVKAKYFWWITVPVLLVILFIVGLIQQGYLGDWIDAYKRADISVKVVDAESQPLDSVQVIFGDKTTITASDGTATLEKLVAGANTMSLRRTGFVSLDQEVTLKKGDNDLGTYTLQKTPAAQVTVTATLVDYISLSSISDATVTLGDIKPTWSNAGDLITFSNVPVGDYTLSATRKNYNDYSAKVTINEKTTTLGKILLVKTGLVVFESNRDQGLRGIFTTNYDASNQKTLVSRVGSLEDYSPSLSPDQTKVFFYSTRDGVKPSGSNEYTEVLYVVNIDGSNLTKISDNVESYNAKWSPDSKLISFMTNYDSTEGYKLRIYNVATKAIVTYDNYIKINSSSVCISSDSKLIAFAGVIKNANTSGLFVANTDGTNIRTIENVDVYYAEFISATTVRYSIYNYSTSSTKYYEYNASANTKNEVSTPAIDKYGATISPNGKLRAYVSTRDGKTNVFISDVNGDNEVQLTTLNKVSGNVLWSLDSSFIMFDYSASGESARYLVSINGTAKAKKIVDINTSSWY